jgi:heat-inducible transcriptional repressor
LLLPAREVVSIQDNLILLILVLKGARIKQLLVTLEHPISQNELSTVSSKLNQYFGGLSGVQIKASGIELTDLEKQIVDNLEKMMQSEDDEEHNQSYLEGLHFMVNQPEFAHNARIPAVMELLEQRALLGTILPASRESEPVRVVIGSENQAEVAQDCSLVIGRYGLKEEANGIILVVGPTRMAYPRIISSVTYLSVLLSRLVAELYGVNTFTGPGGQN